MQKTSAIWKTLLEDDTTARQVKCEINGVEYTDADIYDLKITGALYDTPGVGWTAAREISIQIIPHGEAIPKMATVNPYVRLVNESTVSEWIPKGKFFIDSRETDSSSGTMTIHGYDAMLKSARFMTYAFWRMIQKLRRCEFDAVTITKYIAAEMGVEIDPRTDLLTDITVEPLFEKFYSGTWEFPTNSDAYTMRTVLGYIAAMHGGNWTVTDEGKLYLVPLVPAGLAVYEVIGDEDEAALSIGGVCISTAALSAAASSQGEQSDIVDIGRSCQALKLGKTFDEWSGVCFTKDGVQIAAAGDGIFVARSDGRYDWVVSGRVLQAECPIATDDAANVVLGQIRGAVYRPYDASKADIDPAAELGDMVIVDGIESVMAKLDWTLDSLCVANACAPADDEVAHEFPEDMPVAESVQRVINNTVQQAIAVDTLNIQIVEELPEGHETQNVLWVIPDNDSSSGGTIFH